MAIFADIAADGGKNAKGTMWTSGRTKKTTAEKTKRKKEAQHWVSDVRK